MSFTKSYHPPHASSTMPSSAIAAETTATALEEPEELRSGFDDHGGGTTSYKYHRDPIYHGTGTIHDSEDTLAALELHPQAFDVDGCDRAAFVAAGKLAGCSDDFIADALDAALHMAGSCIEQQLGLDEVSIKIAKRSTNFESPYKWSSAGTVTPSSAGT